MGDYVYVTEVALTISLEDAKRIRREHNLRTRDVTVEKSVDWFSENEIIFTFDNGCSTLVHRGEIDDSPYQNNFRTYFVDRCYPAGDKKSLTDFNDHDMEASINTQHLKRASLKTKNIHCTIDFGETDAHVTVSTTLENAWPTCADVHDAMVVGAKRITDFIVDTLKLPIK